MERRVVITGIGVVSAIGIGKDAFWAGCLSDRTVVAPIPKAWTRFASLGSKVWAPLDEVTFDPAVISRIEQKQLDPFTKNGLHTAFEAVRDAGFDLSMVDEKHRTYRLGGINPQRVGVFMGTGVGGIHTIGECYAHQICTPQARGLKALATNRPENDPPLRESIDALQGDLYFPKRFNPYTVSMLMPNAAAANIAIKLGLTGPNLTYPLACASGTAAIGHGWRAVAREEVDVAVTGGTEYLYDPYGTIFRAFDAVRTLAYDFTPPERANRPFDVQRSGFLFSQGGAAVLVLEDLAHALGRGAVPIAEILAYSESCDATSIMMMAPGGEEMARMLRSLLASGKTAANEVDYINAHGTGTEQNDAVEAEVIERIFRPNVAVNSTKALIGHTMGAAGAIEAAVTALSLKHQATHGSPNLEEPLAKLNFVKHAGPREMVTAVTESFAFGGHNTGLLLRRFKEDGSSRC
jgi:3-oxoacyl-[acyl-carrier-protein] synthase II